MKILIIRFSSIGDIVLCSPVIRCIKKQSGPDSELHFLTKASYVSLLDYNPYIDKVISYDRKFKTAAILKKEKYDLVIDLHKNTRSRSLRILLGVKGITFNKLNVLKWLFVQFKLNYLPNKHLVDRYFDALLNLGIKNDGEGLDYFIPSSVHIKLEALSLTRNEYYVFSIGGTYVTKKLETAQIADIIDGLDKDCVLLGGKEDILSSNIIQKTVTKNKCINLCGELSLHESAYMIQQSAAVVSHDTGMMHIAAAFRKRIISVWGNTHPAFGMYPYIFEKGIERKDLSFIQQVELSCRPCSKLGHKKCPKGHFNCMKMQNVDEIVNKVIQYSLAQ